MTAAPAGSQQVGGRSSRFREHADDGATPVADQCRTPVIWRSASRCINRANRNMLTMNMIATSSDDNSGTLPIRRDRPRPA